MINRHWLPGQGIVTLGQWRNWQTRQTQDLVQKCVRVRVSLSAHLQVQHNGQCIGLPCRGCEFDSHYLLYIPIQLSWQSTHNYNNYIGGRSGGSNPLIGTNLGVPEWFNGQDCKSLVRQFESDHRVTVSTFSV